MATIPTLPTFIEITPVSYILNGVRYPVKSLLAMLKDICPLADPFGPILIKEALEPASSEILAELASSVVAAPVTAIEPFTCNFSIGAVVPIPRYPKKK